ncbi:ankyrin repeat-containing protein ITN1-like [Gossypium arboreum]|uniref:ankyrin repeat-containing protein ITN1-like n=1 Tax=Gossypium arboreum TaxID=29729 RepID=UPI000818F5F0|nr:ankyrin repeat-containing protein ITN1-like [Gossypium arboreum]XP_052882622.1 ankyrin repeat-containing protein ITN1-like [Gossypium arboreum]
MEPEEPEENITQMDAWLYKAAAEGTIEVFNKNQQLQLELLKTPNHDNLLHLNLATQENAAFLFNIFLSVIKFFHLLYGCFSPPMRDLITIIRGEKRSDFIEQILSKCPSLLLQTNAKGQTPLHVAARYGHSAIVKLLIKSCANARDGDLELGMDRVSAVREMLRIRDQESNTALHEAARCGNVEVVKALLEFEDPDFPYSVNKKQETPLYVAARRGDGVMLSILFDKSKSTAHGGPHGRTVLHAAAMATDAEAIRVILEKGNLTKERDEDGRTPLHYAAHLGRRFSVVEELLKRDVSAAYVGDKKRGMTPLLMAARQGYVGTVSKILSLCPDCCEKVDNIGLNLLHYMAFRDSVFPLGSSVFKRGGIEIVYGSVRNLMELEGAFGITPQEVYNSQNHFRKQHPKQKQIKELLAEIENDQVAEEPVRHFRLRNVSTERLEAIRNTHLLVAALIASVAFAAAITVPGGLKSEKSSVEDTPLLILEAAFKAFFVTNALAFIFSVSALFIHFGVLDNLLYRFKFWRETVSYRAQSVSGLLGYATVAMVIAFSTGSYVVLKLSHGLAIFSYLICPTFFFVLHWTIFDYYIVRILLIIDYNILPIPSVNVATLKKY